MRVVVYIALLFLTGLFSCKKIINIDLKNVAPQLVIEGTVTNSSPAKVLLSKTVNFSADNVFPPVTDATVTISDLYGNVYPLLQTSPGTYTNNNLIGTPGATYRLQVVQGGNTYTASSTMPQQVNLDALLTDNIVFAGKIIPIIQPQYTDPVNVANYYWFIEYINGVENKRIFVWDDNLTNGGVSTRPLIEPDSTINAGDTIMVEMRCIDKPIYQYVRGLQDLQNNAATPANPTSNISGGVLGYFSAHTRQRKSVVIPQ
ncbi:DUF4249 domain-containing protein [Hydrotalea sandarakina]|jgi:hypothetical protein|uniref:Uncharacterized protein DUF4249 n=1 Tax=Hydrotalea sandarakina TaxID=1004304 RepID=A0A2W7REX3_9BACT|nr:DUF4249 domain-containing protein [Hydrotalea sandarakina]PZX59463.1 uncharacterized protein DUF4249 [Hydrotalea sandarakina]